MVPHWCIHITIVLKSVHAFRYDTAMFLWVVGIPRDKAKLLSCAYFGIFFVWTISTVVCYSISLTTAWRYPPLGLNIRCIPKLTEQLIFIWCSNGGLRSCFYFFVYKQSIVCNANRHLPLLPWHTPRHHRFKAILLLILPQSDICYWKFYPIFVFVLRKDAKELRKGAKVHSTSIIISHAF